MHVIANSFQLGLKLNSGVENTHVIRLFVRNRAKVTQESEKFTTSLKEVQD